MNKREILEKAKAFVKKKFDSEGTGHDWWHIERVVRNAKTISKEEKGADLFIVELGALLHDIADHKFHGGDYTVGGKETSVWLNKLHVDEMTIEKVRHIVENVSYSKSVGLKNPMRSLEGKIVQDADRLDAMGAVGIARAFAYGGSKGRPLYDPRIKIHKSAKSYKTKSHSAIHHFYEKLLHLKESMNTKVGKEIAKKRHQVLEYYLNEFLLEWEGKK